MKKLVATAAACVLAMALVGCSSDESSTDSKESAPVEQAQKTASAGEAEGDFTVEIGGCTLTEDYEGNPAIVVEYTWTNNNEEAQMFDVAVINQAFQNGIQLDYAFITSDEFDIDASMKEIKTGATQTVYKPYLLDDMSEVSVEVEGWLTDGPVAEKSFTLE